MAGLLCIGCAAGAQEPVRVVSLDLCTDWLLASHLPRARVAALSPTHRLFPLPSMKEAWPFHDNDPETIVRLKPDLVLSGENNALLLRERLRRLGLRVETLPLPVTLAEVTVLERRFRDLLALPAPRAQLPPPADAVARERLLLLGPNGIGTGRNTLEDAMLAYAGWRNYLTADGYVQLDLEQIALDPPDAVSWTAPAGAARANAFIEHPIWRQVLPATRRLDTDTWQWQCPGPWTWETIRQLSHWRKTNERQKPAGRES
jgi:iron complex transport system substrate-binding protein